MSREKNKSNLFVVADYRGEGVPRAKTHARVCYEIGSLDRFHFSIVIFTLIISRCKNHAACTRNPIFRRCKHSYTFIVISFSQSHFKRYEDYCRFVCLANFKSNSISLSMKFKFKIVYNFFK